MGLSRYIIGIDLGTTNSAVSYIDTKQNFDTNPNAKIFQIPQLIEDGICKDRDMLPSFFYIPGSYELAEGSTSLKWDSKRNYAVGEFAKQQGVRVPGRLVNSAKSWLCHGGVDRTDDILPWAGSEDVKKHSPVQISAYFLQHMKESWNDVIAKGNNDLMFENQEIILTVPASFDQIAKELTVQAAMKAGINKVILLEEPQAAFYAWISTHQNDWEKWIKPDQLILICDVGGGTTDFSLIKVLQGKRGLKFERLAVGDHLILGGDNMDIALARKLEIELMGKNKRFDSQQWNSLVHQCRTAKEALLLDFSIEKMDITVQGRGSGVIAGSLNTHLTRNDIINVVLNGFFPNVALDEMPLNKGKVGFKEFGLPYESEPAITKHLNEFLHKQNEFSKENRFDSARPDVILFNGGAFMPEILRGRIVEVVSTWFTDKDNENKVNFKPDVIANDNLHLAVSKGAAYYGFVRRGKGTKIGGGSARSYYLCIESNQSKPDEIKNSIQALCLINKGLEEGEDVEVKNREFKVLTNRPVNFSLYSSSARSNDKIGDVLSLDLSSLNALPPLRTVLKFGKKTGVKKIPVQVAGRFTEVGTLEIFCHSLQTEHKWRLQFLLRGEGIQTDETQAQTHEDMGIEREVIDEALNTIKNALSENSSSNTGVLQLNNNLYNVFRMKKENWSLPLIRPMADLLLQLESKRSISFETEARWLNLLGFCLRPGFGYPLDDFRMSELWKVFLKGLCFERNNQCRSEWWVMWRRVAGGLNKGQQNQLFERTSNILLPDQSKKIKKQYKKPAKQELIEMGLTMASFERLPSKLRVLMGKSILSKIKKGKAIKQDIWALSRIGARVPFHGPIDKVLSPQIVEKWINELLKVQWEDKEQMGYCISHICRKSGDRVRDLQDETIHEVLIKMNAENILKRAIQLVDEIVPLDESEQNKIYGDSLPSGLHLV